MPGRRRGPYSANVVAPVDIQRRAIELRAENKAFTEIAEELGFKSGQAARNAVMAGLAKWAPTEDLDTARQIELQRMDRMVSHLWEVVKAPVMVPATGPDGEPVMVPVDPEDPTLGERQVYIPGPDIEARTKAIDSMAKIELMRIKVLGLEAPKVVHQQGSMTLLHQGKVDADVRIQVVEQTEAYMALMQEAVQDEVGALEDGRRAEKAARERERVEKKRAQEWAASEEDIVDAELVEEGVA